MSNSRKLTIAAVSAALVALGLQLVPASAGPNRGNSDYCRASGPLSAPSLPTVVPAGECDLTGRLVTFGSVGVHVPPPGEGVSADGIALSSEWGLTVATMPNGNVRIQAEGDGPRLHVLGTSTGDPCTDGIATGCLDPCQDTAYRVQDLNGGQNGGKPKVKDSQRWWFNAGSRPDEFPTVSVPRDAIRAGTQNIVTTDNDCGLSDVVPKTAPYEGTTSRTSDMKHPNGTVTTCKSSSQSDGKSTVDFGRLITAVGLACTFYISTDGVHWFIKQADIRLRINGGANDPNPNDTEWTTVVDPDTCSDLMDVESVVTHERGHAFGLKHPCEAATAPVCTDQSHLLQTMYFAGPDCYTYGRTLGKGDRKGLTVLY